MKIIISGAGELGTHLTKLLSFEFLDITLIDIDPDALVYANNHFDIRTIVGDATSISVLEEAEVATTDLVIAVSSSETVNITTCAIAKQMGAKRTIARIYNTEFLEERNKVGFKKFGIDELISPELLAAQEIIQLLDQTAFNDTFEFEDGALQLIGIYLSSTSQMIGKTVEEVGKNNPDLKYVAVAMKRSGAQKTIIPNGDTVFKEGDRVYMTTVGRGIEKIVELTGKKHHRIRNVMILGGSKIGVKAAEILSEKGVYVKLVENRREKAEQIADSLPKVSIIHADGRDMDVLEEEESLSSMDSFVSVTDKSETNIMACLAAKARHVKKAIALVENLGYFQISHSVGIDTVINKKTLTANKIFRFVRKGKVMAVINLSNMRAEFIEFKATTESRASHKKIKDLDFPEGAIIGGVIRKKEGIIALGDFEIKPGDRLVVCCLPQVIKKVERLFEK